MYCYCHHPAIQKKMFWQDTNLPACSGSLLFLQLQNPLWEVGQQDSWFLTIENLWNILKVQAKFSIEMEHEDNLQNMGKDKEMCRRQRQSIHLKFPCPIFLHISMVRDKHIRKFFVLYFFVKFFHLLRISKLSFSIIGKIY